MSTTDRHSQPGGEQWVSGGGSQTTTVPSGAGNTIVKNEGGRLCRALVTSTGTGLSPVLFYDSAGGATGVLIGVVDGNASAGDVAEFDMPAITGIVVANVANGPALTVSYF